MRVALLSDTHGFVDPRIAERVTECDIAVHAGDIGGADVLLSLQPREELVAIRGNNDTPERWSEGERHVLDTLPAETALDLPGGRLVVLHGDDSGTLAQRGRRYRRRFHDAAAVVFGHSHRLSTDLDEHPWLLNPGAAGRTRTNGGPSMLVLTCGDDGPWRVEPLRFDPGRYPSLRRRGRSARETGDDESE